MTEWNDRLMQALTKQGLVVRDVTRILERHPTRTYATRDPGKLRGLVWHQALSYGYGQRAVEAIARYHVSPQSHLKAGGAPGFAYTMAVDADGTVFLGQPVELATWSHGQHEVPDANTRLIGVCALGRYSYTEATGTVHRYDEPPPPQEAALVRLWRAAQELWGWHADAEQGGLLGHDDLGKPACPGDRLGLLQERVRAGLPAPAPVSSLTLTGRARVAYQQACLASLGYSMGAAGIDGLDGVVTQSAVASFQHDHGLSVDGIWGPITEAAIRPLLLARYPSGTVET